MNPNIDTAALTPDYDNLVRFLRDRYDRDLRWVASFDTDSHQYTVEYIREDLKTELTSRDLDIVIHRSIALFNRPYVEEVYTHLGHAQSLILQHELATAVHIYLSENEGITIKIRAGNDISLPGFIEDCLEALYPERR